MEFRDFSLHLNQTKVSRFAEELASGRIMATQCKTCTMKWFPPRADCARCGTSHMDWIPVRGHGKLITFTMIYVPPDRFASQPQMPFSSITFQPCPIGLLEVEHGFRVMGWIPHVDPAVLHVGLPMRAVPHTLTDGKVTIVLEPSDPPAVTP
jgi:uncharacterized OB-fold protein